MLSKMTTARIKPEHLEEAVAFVRDEFAPAAAEQPGFLGFTLMVNREQNTITGITFWDSEDSLVSSDSADITSKLRTLGYHPSFDISAAAMA